MSFAIRSASLAAHCLLAHCHYVYYMMCCTVPICLCVAAHSTCLFTPKTSISDLTQPDCKPDQSHRSLSVHSSLSTGCILTHGQTAICWACRLSQGWTRTQGRLRLGSQAGAASVRSWCLCRGPMQQQRKMMATCWAWSMMPPSTKASSL